MNKLSKLAYKTDTCDTCPLRTPCRVGRSGRKRCKIGRNVLINIYLAVFLVVELVVIVVS